MEEAKIKQIIERQPYMALRSSTHAARYFFWSALVLSVIFWPEKLSVSRSCWFMGCLLPWVTVENGLSK